MGLFRSLTFMKHNTKSTGERSLSLSAKRLSVLYGERDHWSEEWSIRSGMSPTPENSGRGRGGTERSSREKKKVNLEEEKKKKRKMFK